MNRLNQTSIYLKQTRGYYTNKLKNNKDLTKEQKDAINDIIKEINIRLCELNMELNR